MEIKSLPVQSMKALKILCNENIKTVNQMISKSFGFAFCVHAMLMILYIVVYSYSFTHFNVLTCFCITLLFCSKHRGSVLCHETKRAQIGNC